MIFEEIWIMREEFSRTGLILGAEAMDRLGAAKVAVFGIGGVGGHVVEALVRSGIGAIDIVDNDTVSVTNINRQIIALQSTVGKSKVRVMADRIRDINPDCTVGEYECFYLPETKDEFDFLQYDYIVDAVDTVTAKISLVEEATRLNVPIISSMGAGNKLDPTAFEVADIYKTSVCPLAKVMRRELKKRGIQRLKVVYSTEEAIQPKGITDELSSKRCIPGSNAFVPAVAGLIIASEVIKDIAVKKISKNK